MRAAQMRSTTFGCRVETASATLSVAGWNENAFVEFGLKVVDAARAGFLILPKYKARVLRDGVCSRSTLGAGFCAALDAARLLRRYILEIALCVRVAC